MYVSKHIDMIYFLLSKHEDLRNTIDGACTRLLPGSHTASYHITVYREIPAFVSFLPLSPLLSADKFTSKTGLNRKYFYIAVLIR